MSFFYYFVAVSYEIAAIIVITLARIVVYECTTLDSDSSRVVVLLIQDIVEPSPIIVCLEESSLNNDVAAITFDNRVSFTFGIASNCKCATFNCNCCTICYMYTLVISTRAAIECTCSDSNISICTCCFYCNSICIRCCNASVKSVRSFSKLFTFSYCFSVLSILIVLISYAVIFYSILSFSTVSCVAYTVMLMPSMSVPDIHCLLIPAYVPESYKFMQVQPLLQDAVPSINIYTVDSPVNDFIQFFITLNSSHLDLVLQCQISFVHNSKSGSL